MSGAGYGDLERISETDQQRWSHYNPPDVGAFTRMNEAILKIAEPTPSNWQPVETLPKQGRILATSRYTGNAWGEPYVFEWNARAELFDCRKRGICIYPQFADKWVGLPIPEFPA
jgi:hypothetical protein